MSDYQFQSQEINLLEPRQFKSPDEPPKSKKRVLLFIIILVLLVGGANCALRRFTIGDLPAEAASYDPVTLRPQKIGFLKTVKNFIFHSNNFLWGEAEDRVNILLLGMGGPGHDGPFLTDTNIVVSFKPSTREVVFISVPRDLGVEVNGHGLKKINFVNALGEAEKPGTGGEYARRAFAETFALDIPYYIRLDFDAFVELIDTVGGVDIDVAQSFMDESYPGPNNSYQTISFPKGLQHMDGQTALKYARSRHGTNGEGSDFARAHRQQQILTALKDKLLSFGTYTNPLKVQSIISSLTKHLSTNMEFGQLMYLASLGREIDNKIKTVVLDNGDKGYLESANVPGVGFILRPRTGNFSEINQLVKNIFSPGQPANAGSEPIQNLSGATGAVNPSIFPQASIEIQNGTWRVGLAQRLQKKLEDAGFTVTAIGNAWNRPQKITAVYLINRQVTEEVKKNLTEKLGIKFTNSLPLWLQEDFDDPATPESENGPKFKANTDVLIILGDDTPV